MNLGLIGNPVKKSISPQLQKILFKELDLINFRYKKYDITPDNLPSFFEKFDKKKFDGINITIPYKETSLQFIHEVDSDAKILGNINCIKRTDNILKGYIKVHKLPTCTT